MPYSDKFFFQAYVFLELLSDGGVKVVTVRNRCIDYVCFFYGFA